MVRGEEDETTETEVSVTLDEDIVKRVKELSEEQQRSFSQYINLVLTEHLKHLEQTEK